MSEIIAEITGNSTWVKLIITLVLIVINIIAVQLTSKVLFKTIRNTSTYYNLRKRFYYTFTLILILLIILVWSGSKLDLSTYMGFISAGIAIALREIFTNIAAWFIIIFQKPFEVGDRISVDGRSGDIIDIKLFQIVLLEVSSAQYGEQSTGRIVHIPNNYLFLHAISNANKGFDYIWNEIDVTISLDSDWESFKAMLETVANKQSLHITSDVKESLHEASKRYMLYYKNITPIVYVKVRESAIVLTVRYLCETRRARVTEDAMWQEILKGVKALETVKLV
jgi:small-conductance mechanosensitive channel